MPSPFPGMDPYLDAVDIWPDLHDRLASEISVQLNQQLPPSYYARLEMRPEIGIIGDDRRGRIIPDIAVMSQRRQPVQAGNLAVAEPPRAAESKHIDLDISELHEPIRHHFVEIRDSLREHKLITLIEIVSPSNKRKGPDREAYLTKQSEVLRSETNLVEIDLLRTGERLITFPQITMALFEHDPRPDYVVLVNRASRRIGNVVGQPTLYPFTVRELLPCIAIPLKREDADVLLDLQYVFQRAYDGGPYRRGAVDYSQPPDPPLRDEDTAWAAGLLAPQLNEG